ncbi:hypothetical protein [Microbacterium arborescens]|uniref:hypothetical protein n=1 Tax=Microbacterium arborescens TaxID=33883 RepID=UPI000DF83F33|nr:hypothetical protein [Microbacterium arborescens]
MKRIEQVEELAELPDRSVVVLASEVTDDRWWMDTSIYQKFGTWTEMDPTDRYDGEQSWDNEALIVIANVRDKRIIWLAFDPREVPATEPNHTDGRTE